jgi:predicted DNA-binding transcriptional regulator AlpA
MGPRAVKQEALPRKRNRRPVDPDVAQTLTIPQACALLGIGTSTGYTLAARGEPYGTPGHFPVRMVTIGTVKKILKADMDRYLAGATAVAG